MIYFIGSDVSNNNNNNHNNNNITETTSSKIRTKNKIMKKMKILENLCLQYVNLTGWGKKKFLN